MYAGLIALSLMAVLGLHLTAQLRMMRAAESRVSTANLSRKYQPMLRLLSENDLAIVAGSPELMKKLRAERRAIFRRYLDCLVKDYAQLLAGLRRVMVESSVDRPELARALAKNRFLFAVAICKIQYRLALHAAGIGTVDISGIVAAFDGMRRFVSTAEKTLVSAAA